MDDNILDKKIKVAEETLNNKQKERFDTYDKLQTLVKEEDDLRKEVVRLKSLKQSESSIGKCYRGVHILVGERSTIVYYIRVKESGYVEYFSITYDAVTTDIINVNLYVNDNSLIRNDYEKEALTFISSNGNIVCIVEEILNDEYEKMYSKFFIKEFPKFLNIN